MLPLIVFFLSGAAALLYQVIWQRMLVIFSGGDVYSVTVIVASFMAGLGAGGLAGGHLADRLGTRANLYVFAGAELFVGLFGLISKAIYYDTLYIRFSYLAAAPATAAVVLFSTLLVPTFLMGLSLPLLSRALASSLWASPRVIGSLYGCNTLGAALGAFTAPWVFIPRFGLDRSLWIAAALNAICAMLAVGFARRLANPGQSSAAGRADVPGLEPGTLSFRTWLMLYGLSGFIALGLEIAWFRLLGVLLKSTSFTFGTLLGVYLTGLGAGAAVGARAVARSHRPGLTFLVLQFSIAIVTALSIVGLVAALAGGHPVKLVRFLGSYEPVDVRAILAPLSQGGWPDRAAVRALGDFALLYLVIPAALVGPSTFLMGMSFPYLQRAVQTDFPRLGRRLGALLAVNIGGGVCGAILTGWIFLPVLGTAGTIRALVTTSGAALGWALVRATRALPRTLRMAGGSAVVLITIASVWMMPANATLWAGLHGATPRQILFDEDGAGLSLLKRDRADGVVEVYVNGLGQSWLPYGNIHTALGALPAFIHPMPRDVALIGLGSGDTAFAAAGRREISRLVSIEILASQRKTLQQLARITRYPGLIGVLSDPRIEHRVGDGRAYIMHAERTFDIIEADALRPSSAYAGNLYSREYFSLVASHLKPGGYGVTWAPTASIQATFRNVFPHVLAFPGDIFIGSFSPIRFDPAEVTARLSDARYYYEASGVDILALLKPLVDAPQHFTSRDARPVAKINTDLTPHDEFALPFW